VGGGDALPGRVPGGSPVDLGKAVAGGDWRKALAE
jgi:hypothetical protein